MDSAYSWDQWWWNRLHSTRLESDKYPEKTLVAGRFDSMISGVLSVARFLHARDVR